MYLPSTVLVVEDDENIRELLCSTLEINGYQVLSTDNGEEGIELARTQRPDLVLCDAALPRGSGADVLRAVRENPITVGTTFLLMTGKQQGTKHEMTQEREVVCGDLFAFKVERSQTEG